MNEPQVVEFPKMDHRKVCYGESCPCRYEEAR